MFDVAIKNMTERARVLQKASGSVGVMEAASDRSGKAEPQCVHLCANSGSILQFLESVAVRWIVVFCGEPR